MKTIVIGITASVSIYKTCELIRLLKKDNYNIRVVMSKNSTKLIQPLLFETLSENRVYVEMFSEKREMGHISLKENCDLMVVVPADANIIGKFSSGIADDLISTTLISMKCPIIMAAAMNPDMWNNFAVQRNIQYLKENDIVFVEPDAGKVVCGDSGIGKLASVGKIYEKIKNTIK